MHKVRLAIALVVAVLAGAVPVTSASAASGFSVVSGTVRDRITSTPLAGIEVDLIHARTKTIPPAEIAFTDARGQYQLLVTSGDWSIVFVDRTFRYSIQFWYAKTTAFIPDANVLHVSHHMNGVDAEMDLEDRFAWKDVVIPPLQLPWPVGQSHGISGYTYGPDCGDHKGKDLYAIDFGLGYGDSVAAVADGTAYTFPAAISGGYGNAVLIEHGIGYYTVYAHLSQFNVTNGQAVHQNDVIGLAGSTGNSTGPHLHFALRRLYPFSPNKLRDELFGGDPYIPEPMSIYRDFGVYAGQAFTSTNCRLRVAPSPIYTSSTPVPPPVFV